jgi:hypothetical protein
MNGELRLAKPPLPTWVAAGVGLCVGNIEKIAALRLPAALMGSFLVWCLFAMARISLDTTWRRSQNGSRISYPSVMCRWLAVIQRWHMIMSIRTCAAHASFDSQCVFS